MVGLLKQQHTQREQSTTWKHVRSGFIREYCVFHGRVKGVTGKSCRLPIQKEESSKQLKNTKRKILGMLFAEENVNY